MTEANFILKNEEQWKSLESYNKMVAKRGIRKLEKSEVREFAHLFRLASHHLAYSKTHYPKSHVIPYLNNILGVSHNHFYVRESKTISDICKYFTHIFPETVRETWRYWLVATIIFAISIIFAGFYVAHDHYQLNMIMPHGFGHFTPGEVPDLGDGTVHWEHSLMASIITTNNITVSFNAIAGGLLAGIGTLYILIYNGLLIGALFGFFHSVGADLIVAYALVLPHGIIELAAIFICGGCGLMLAKGLLIPGQTTRKQSLIIAAKKTALLIPGIVMMLVVAGVIEGYFTPMSIHAVYKLIFAALTFVLLVTYFRSCGRRYS